MPLNDIPAVHGMPSHRPRAVALVVVVWGIFSSERETADTCGRLQEGAGWMHDGLPLTGSLINVCVQHGE